MSSLLVICYGISVYLSFVHSRIIMTVATSGVGTAYPSKAHELIPVFKLGL
jgi:hypothetical protein